MLLYTDYELSIFLIEGGKNFGKRGKALFPFSLYFLMKTTSKIIIMVVRE